MLAKKILVFKLKIGVDVIAEEVGIGADHVMLKDPVLMQVQVQDKKVHVGMGPFAHFAAPDVPVVLQKDVVAASYAPEEKLMRQREECLTQMRMDRTGIIAPSAADAARVGMNS